MRSFFPLPRCILARSCGENTTALPTSFKLTHYRPSHPRRWLGGEAVFRFSEDEPSHMIGDEEAEERVKQTTV